MAKEKSVIEQCLDFAFKDLGQPLSNFEGGHNDPTTNVALRLRGIGFCFMAYVYLLLEERQEKRSKETNNTQSSSTGA